jgi:acetyltransferase-like isoleucine patch superfamily enzyme
MYSLEKTAYLLRVLRTNPFELTHLIGVGLNTFFFRHIRRCVGAGTVVGRKTVIVNSGNVKIGKNCLLQDGVYIRAGTDGRVTIRDGVAINSFCRLFGHGGITIAEDTQMGPGSLITTTTHDYSRQLEARFREVTIGRRVWIGANVTVLPGVTIGDGAVIGAGSVVTKNVRPGVIAVGNPAHEIRCLDERSSSSGPVALSAHAIK